MSPTDRIVPPAEITAALLKAGAVLIDSPEYRRCPITNAYHRIHQIFDEDIVLSDNPHIIRGMKNALYKAIFTRWPSADIHDCQLQVWKEPCITYIPLRQRCFRGDPFRSSQRSAHMHVYARVTYSEESLPRPDRIHSQTVKVAR